MLPSVELDGRSLSVTVRAADIALVDLGHDLVPRELSRDQLRNRRNLGGAVAMVELQAPHVCLAAVDTGILVEISADSKRESGSDLARANAGDLTVSQTVLLVPISTATTTAPLESVGGGAATVELSDRQDQVAGRASLGVIHEAANQEPRTQSRTAFKCAPGQSRTDGPPIKSRLH